MNKYIIINGELHHSDELYHYGILGMKWGKRKGNYKSTSIRSAIARKKNEKVDAGFDDWKKNAKLRDDAISAGKKATTAKIAYENNKSDPTLKSEYKTANKEYKKALGKNTTYRKGVVRSEVGKDLSRKYLSEAKKVKKKLDQDPTNKELSKEYNKLMSKHDVERAKARKAIDVGQRRSNFKAGVKRTMTMTIKAAAATATVAAGAYAVNRYLKSKNVRINGKAAHIGKEAISNVANLAKKARELMGFLY